MATGYFDFASDTIGQEPAGLTSILNTSSATWTVQDDGAGGKCLRLSRSGTADAGMSIDAVGVTSGDVEIYATFRTAAKNGSQVGVGTLMETDTFTSGAAKSYVAAFLQENDLLGTRRRVDTIMSTWTPEPTFVWEINTLYHVRLRVLTSTGSAYVRAWADGVAEPETWDANSNEALSTLTSGHLGPISRDVNGPQEWLFIGWATEGDEAPTSAGTQLATPSNFTFTAAANARQVDGSWSAVTGAGSYDWVVEEDVSAAWYPFASGNTATTAFQLTDADGVEWSTSYRCRVRALPA